jgi:ABC-2 type transport system ATP-binding protein
VGVQLQESELALVGNARIAILDELTTGLDPQARRDTWQLIEDVRARGVTVLLVTHSMEEAERLCDWIALIDAELPGLVVAALAPTARAGTALGTPLLHGRHYADRRSCGRPDLPLGVT